MEGKGFHWASVLIRRVEEQRLPGNTQVPYMKSDLHYLPPKIGPDLDNICMEAVKLKDRMSTVL